MFHSDGQSYFVVDGHVHFWDGSPANQINRYGEGFVRGLYGFHRRLSPDEHRWTLEEFERYPEQRLIDDLFEAGPDDVAILQPTGRPDWFVNGFETTEQNGEIAQRHPGRFIVNGRWDPRDGEAGLAELEALHERWQLPGVLVGPAEWKGISKGWRLSDPWAHRYLEKCQELGIRNIHVHPTNGDLADVDDAATAFPGLRFFVEHVGLPRIEDFCWTAAQEPNVYGGLAVALPFLHTRPRYFARIIGELLYWIGENRILFGSNYAVGHPKWLVERFVDFQIPDDLQSEYGVLTPAIKQKILGLNAAHLYDLKVE
ncbi:amidohydrolase [Actinoplanes sp. TRM 88003]|uniref:Amidohydrolase n=1 Tax=Paractinoplanes aksuensis TaxID=2939490 RepID=A0ABT1DGK5_9ACTN|nr:amidohydrolase family protein [Actinoplanes aksuensis]MCO8269973.1 amidohydrolase [Actinoplanes aksuensis]